MASLIRAILVALVVAAPVALFAQSSASVAAHGQAKISDIFVDQHPGFTFVKMPDGWKFVGAVSREDAQHLPDRVLTAVVSSEGEEVIDGAGRRSSGWPFPSTSCQ
jgi:hypothetical protein